jgi:hypothetical protein
MHSTKSTGQHQLYSISITAHFRCTYAGARLPSDSTSSMFSLRFRLHPSFRLILPQFLIAQQPDYLPVHASCDPHQNDTDPPYPKAKSAPIRYLSARDQVCCFWERAPNSTIPQRLLQFHFHAGLHTHQCPHALRHFQAPFLIYLLLSVLYPLFPPFPLRSEAIPCYPLATRRIGSLLSPFYLFVSLLYPPSLTNTRKGSAFPQTEST